MYGLSADSPEWVQYAMMGDLAGRCEAAAEKCEQAAQRVQDEKAKPRGNTLVVTPETATLLADEIARALLVLRTDTARKVEASLHTSAESVMRAVAQSAFSVAPRFYTLRVLALTTVGVVLCLMAGYLAGHVSALAHTISLKHGH